MSEPTTKQPYCYDCKINLPSWDILVEHIWKDRGSHSERSVKFAQDYKLRHAIFKPADKNDNRMPLDEQEKQNKIDAQRMLSGITKSTSTVCPHCYKPHFEIIPIEHIQSPSAWRKGKTLMITCDNCSSVKKLHYGY